MFWPYEPLYSTHKPNKPEANVTFVSTLVLHFMVVKATSSYTERKEIQARIGGHTWESHLKPPA